MLLGIPLIIIGLALTESLLATQGFTVLGILGFVIAGVPFLAFGGILTYMDISGRLRKSKENAGKEQYKEKFLPRYPSVPDRNETDHKLTEFRQVYGAYFTPDAPEENAPVQEKVSQIFWHILHLQRLRLRKMGLNMTFQSERKDYGTRAVESHDDFDGKYEIRTISECIAARSDYYKDGKRIYRKIDCETANYTITKARETGADRVICPNCGAEADRSNLLDGCDYCGTRFTIEDLGDRVADFGLRKSYVVEDAKYRKALLDINGYLVAGIFLIVFLISLGMTLYSLHTGSALEGSPGFFVSLVAVAGTTLIAGGLFAIVLVPIMSLAVLPAVNIGASAYFMTKKALNHMRDTIRRDPYVEQTVRKTDPLFSITGFYAGVQNKLAAVHYAEDPRAVNAFAACDLSGIVPSYADVISMEVQEMALKNYWIEKNLQMAEVEALLRLVRFDGEKRCKASLEKVILTLSKAADCKTQAVCAPAVMKCSGCGSALSLLDGKICPYCGRELDLEKYDWIIQKYFVALQS